MSVDVDTTPQNPEATEIPTLDELLASETVEIGFDIVDAKASRKAGGKRAQKEAEFAKLADRFQPFVDKAFENPELTVTVGAQITDRPLARKLNDHFGRDFQATELPVTDENGNFIPATDEEGADTRLTETVELRLVVGTVKHGEAVVTTTSTNEDGSTSTKESTVPTYLLTFTATSAAPKERKTKSGSIVDVTPEPEGVPAETPAKPAGRRRRGAAAAE